jgi:membrane protease subunit HflK
MLTHDANIVNIEFSVQYRIRDVKKFLFVLNEPEVTLKKAAEAAMRQVIGSTDIDEALTTGKTKIQIETRNILQKIMDKYDSGILITAVQLQDVFPPREVMAAFKDVASAKEDQSRLVNEAEAYKNELIPKTEGEIKKIIYQAEAKARQIIEQAKGKSNKFLKMYEEYKKAKDITKKRYYYEYMKESLKDVNKVIIDDKGNPVFGKILKLMNVNDGGKK